MARFVLNVDVPDIERGVAFYTQAFGLSLSRRFDTDFVELSGAETRIYLLRKEENSAIGPAGSGQRCYSRHWTPVHPDFVVDDLDAAIARAEEAGARCEGEVSDQPYGRLAMFCDPFGHGFCLIEFNEKGYDAIAT